MNDQTSARLLDIAVASNCGLVRQENQDVPVADGWAGAGPDLFWSRRLAQLDRPIACAVIDGMGGHTGGATAAWLAARHIVSSAAGLTSSDASRALAENAHLEIRNAGRGLGMPEMGAAIAALILRPDGFDVFNVGDCRAYRVADGVLGQLTVDDSGPSRVDPNRLVLMQSVGGSEPYQIDTHWFSGSYGRGRQRFLVASDGLNAASRTAVDAAVALDDPATAVRRLISAALDGGAPDNVTVIVADVASQSRAVPQRS